jgi:hypothetical protein
MSHPLEGRVRTWSIDAAVIDGLEGAALYDRVEFEGGAQGFVSALHRDHVEVAPLDSSPPAARAGVRVAGPLAVPAGDDLIGCDVDALGRPLDGGPSLNRGILRPVFFPPAPWTHEPARRRLTTGMLVYDLNRVIPMGSTVLAAGQAPFLFRQILRHQALEGRVCIYARPGAAGTSGHSFRDRANLEDQRLAAATEALPPCVVIEGGQDPSPAAQWLVPWTAMAVAAALCDRGRDAVVILDSLDAWRPFVERFPNEGEWLSQVGRLASLTRCAPGGSVSLLAAAGPKAALALDSYFDVELDLERALRGAPIQDGSKLARPPFKTDAAGLGRAILRLAELEELETRFPWQTAAEEGRRLRAGLWFRPGMSADSAEQLISFLALCDLSELPSSAVPEFLVAFENRLRRQHGPRLAAIRKQRAYGEPDRAEFTSIAREICRALLR